jgi:LysM repeat protein
MKPWKRLAFYILLNIFVSALTTWGIITLWDHSHPRARPATEGLVATLPTPAASLTTQPGVTSSANQLPAGSAQLPVASQPTQAVEEYQVSANDTLGEIASKYGLSVEEIMKFNQLTDPNALSVGMVIYIPVTPEIIPTDTPAPTITKIAGATSSGENTAGVVINSVIGVGDLSSERVFISRTGSGVLLLVGWRLKDQDGNEFIFPYLELFEGGAVNVWTTAGSQTVVDLYWGLRYPVWKPGETVVLVDDKGKLQASYQIP